MTFTCLAEFTPSAFLMGWIIIIVKCPLFHPTGNGSLRICIDPRQLNKALKREHYKLPTLDDVLPEFKDAKIFTKLDVKEAFWHIKLDEESSKLTTMITPFGRVRWTRMPFGLNVSSEIFQRHLATALDALPGLINVADDILVIRKGTTNTTGRLVTIQVWQDGASC